MSHDPALEAATLDAARAGDLLAWEQVTRRHQELVFRSAYLSTRDSISAEETSKRTFMRAFRSLGSLQPGAALRPWLLGIAATVARAHQRELAQRRDARLVDPDPCPRVAATPVLLPPGMPHPSPAEHDALVDAFDGLIDDDRHLIAARYGFGLSRDEAVVRLGIPAGEVDGRLATSMKRLRARSAEAVGGGVPPSYDGDPGARLGPGLDHLAHLTDDQLGAMAMVAVLSELTWTPDVAPVVCARLAREAGAYPEGLARPQSSAAAWGRGAASPASGRERQVEGVGPTPRPAGHGRALASITGIALVVVVLAGAPMVLTRGWGLPGEGSGGGASPALGAPALGAPALGAPAVVMGTEAVPSSASAPTVSIVAARTLADGDVGATVRFAWSPVAFGPVTEARLERDSGDGSWAWVGSVPGGGPLEASLEAGDRYHYRVRTLDGAGSSVVSPPVRVALAVRDPRSGRLALAPGEWETRYGDLIKRRLVATTADASLSTRFTGSHVALVGPTGPTRGALGVRVDDGAWSLDDLRGLATSPRTIIYAQQLAPGRHSLDLRAQAHGLAVDAVLIVRAQGS
jgi:RNA polymerase sigma-70 factor (ECF subfamily)